MNGAALPCRAVAYRLHLQQFDQSLTARQYAVAFEEGLPLERFEPHVLRQGVDEILIGQRRRESGLAAFTLDRGRQPRLEPLTEPMQFGTVRGGDLLRQRIDDREAVRLAALFTGDAKSLDPLEDDIEAPVGERFGMRNHSGA